MRTIVAVIVYDRLHNIEEWLRVWPMCETKGAELIIIHNFKNEEDRERCQKMCFDAQVGYVPRENIGMDIGAFQDVCRGRLPGFPNQWDHLLWCTDDTIPMSRGFITHFLHAVNKPGIGVACLEFSREVKPHIRTSGFIVSQQTASKINFPAERVTTKLECYEFEHRSKHAFYEQVKKMGKKVVQVHPVLKDSYLWDTQNRANLNLKKKHYEVFPVVRNVTNDKVTVICPIYNSYPQIISSLICQTHQNWNLLLIHDGPNNTNLKKIVENANDERIIYIETPDRQHNWGHHLRKWALDEMKNGNIQKGSGYVLITNPDNYYVPSAIEELLKGFNDPSVIATYPLSFVHGYLSPQPEGDHRFGVIKTRLELGWIDCGCMMIRKDVACDVGWKSMEIYSDWEFFSDIINKYGKDNINRVLGCLFVHN